MKRSQLPLIALLIWFFSTLYLLLGAIFFNRASLEGVLLIITSQLLLMGVILPCALYIFPRYWRKEKIVQLAGCLLGLVVSFVLTRYVLEEILFIHWFDFSPNEHLDPLFFIYENFYYSFPGVFIGLIIYLLSKSYHTEEKNQTLAKELKLAELSFLKSQLNPHFLYNTLNYLYAMALPVPGNLSKAIMKLSKTLQYTLDKNRNELVSLQEEITFIEDYLSLYALRFSPHFHYQFKQEGCTEDIQLPPLLLLPFIENTIKHGVTNDITSPVHILLMVSQTHLTLEVSNRINGHSFEESTGVGLENVKRRLELIYPNRYSLHLDSIEETFYSSLKIALS